MKYMKWVILFTVVCALVAVLWFTKSPSASNLRQLATKRLTPYVNFSSLNVVDANEERISVISKIDVSNPYPMDIHAKGLNYQVYLDSVLVVEEVYRQPITIRSSDTITIELPMNIQAEAMARVQRYLRARNADSANYHVKARILMDVPVAGQKGINLNITKRLPVLRVPEMKIKDVKFDLLKLKSKA